LSRRPTLLELRHALLVECLDDTWRTASECRELLGLGGGDWYRLTTALERLVNDGYAELKHPGATVRRFRRLQEPTS
jgi:hypothetical protein